MRCGERCAASSPAAPIVIKVMATGAMLSSETEDARAIQYSLDELRAAVEVAHANFKPVAAHAHAREGIVNAVAAGVDSIEHCTFADDDALRRIAAAGTFVVPTICAGELLLARRGDGRRDARAPAAADGRVQRGPPGDDRAGP